MRLGLIARCEMARGLAIQGRNFYNNMPVDKVLCVRMPRTEGAECPEWYANRTDARYDMRAWSLDETVVKDWLRDLDVVFAVETPHDWRIPRWCQEQGVRLVIQGNPEFVRHGIENLSHPDQWWWPTSWRLDDLPEGIVMPVPMDRRPAKRSGDLRLHVLHVIGKRAHADRNGTEILIQAMRMVFSPMKLTVHSIDGDVAQFSRNRHVELKLNLNPVHDQWSMYNDQDILVTPRRYGGLSLPALEATAAGLVVMMTDCSPNEELASFRVPARSRGNLNLACGPVQGWDANPNELAVMLDAIAHEWPTRAEEWRQRQGELLTTWDEMRPRYMQALKALL